MILNIHTKSCFLLEKWWEIVFGGRGNLSRPKRLGYVPWGGAAQVSEDNIWWQTVREKKKIEELEWISECVFSSFKISYL